MKTENIINMFTRSSRACLTVLEQSSKIAVAVGKEHSQQGFVDARITTVGLGVWSEKEANVFR